MTEQQTTPAGWYDDGSGGRRYWDGSSWTGDAVPGGTDDATSDASSEASVAARVEAGGKSFITTWLLALLVGVFGADRFYLGKIGTAIAKLVTLGGLGVWVLIDLILVLTGAQRDAAGRRLVGYPKHRTMAWAVTGGLLVLSVLTSSIGAAGLAARAPAAEPTAAGSDSRSADERETEGAPSEKPAKPAAQDLAIVESAFGKDVTSDTWWYAVVLENPNSDYVFPTAPITIEAVDANGVILDSTTELATILQGRTVVVGDLFSVGAGTIAKLEVRGPTAAAATSSPAAETGALTVSNIASSEEYGWRTVTGNVTSTFGEDQKLVKVAVIARDGAGAIVGSDFTFIDRLPAGGTAQFESALWQIESLPVDVVFEAYAGL